MKVNRNTVLVGNKLVLAPYRKQHVPRYHEWMMDPLIQEQTASEPLSIEEEYEMQQSWAVDEDKLTFIILAQSDDCQREQMTDLNAEQLISECTMVGDVNIFFNQRHDENDDNGTEKPADASKDDAGAQNSTKTLFDAECEIMIAEHGHRRRGIARAALEMMFAFVTSASTPTAASPNIILATAVQPPAGSPHCSLPIPLEWLTCKISLQNTPSIKLFESLGFTRQSVSEVWQEVEMRLTDKNSAHLDRCQRSIQRVLFWPDD